MTNLRSLDLNLLTVFEAVFEEGSIARAAERLALSPSATSHALARLREASRDELFVRLGQGIAPTPVAQRMHPEVKRALEGLRRALAEAQGFDPARSTRAFRVAIPHPMGPLWALALKARIADAAPGVRIAFDTQTLPVDPYDRMRDGTLDLAIDWVPAAGERFVNRRLIEEDLVFIVRGGHPAAGTRLDRAALARHGFVRPHPRHAPQAEAVRVARDALAPLGLDWRLEVSEFLEVPFLVAQTDLVGFVPRSVFTLAERTPALLGTVTLPVALPRIPTFAVWHETRRGDEGHRWLRDLVAEEVIATG